MQKTGHVAVNVGNYATGTQNSLHFLLHVLTFFITKILKQSPPPRNLPICQCLPSLPQPTSCRGKVTVDVLIVSLNPKPPDEGLI